MLSKYRYSDTSIIRYDMREEKPKQQRTTRISRNSLYIVI